MRDKNDTTAGNRTQTLQLLQKSNTRLAARHLGELIREAGRFERFSLGIKGLLLDYSRVRIDARAVAELLHLATAAGLKQSRNALFAGDKVNRTEQRPALHMALRSPQLLSSVDPADAARVRQAHETMLKLAGELHQGRLPGASGARVRHIVHVGIGGSLLGTRLVCEALDQGDSPLTAHFLGSVDALMRERLMARIDPAETVVILVSKSFTTGDTLLHGQRLNDWLTGALGEEGASQRLYAVSSRPDRAREFGVAEQHILYLPDWVGGRFSLWSPVSLTAAALVGPRRFEELLAGAACMDTHFQDASLPGNLPVVFGLLGIWHRNICQYRAWGVMPYDQRLRLLPAYLQQLIMESTGKSVTVEGEPAGLATAPVVFGETGTEAQHSVFQAMHQGYDIVPLNFIGVIRPAHSDRAAHDELLANLLAQVTALASGRDEAQTRAELGERNAALLPHRTFAGNRPSELILLDELNPFNLGMLLALYEHKVFVESVIWDINAFDQWGVELGKTLAPGIQSVLREGGDADPSLTQVLDYIQERR